jgi:hypothetical protein
MPLFIKFEVNFSMMNPRQDYFSRKLSRSFSGDTLSRAVDRVIKNQDRYYKLLRSTGEPGIDNLIDSIHRSNFFMAHCHSHHHYASGLAEHSLGVYDRMCRLAKGYELEQKDIILTALLHDLCSASKEDWPHVSGKHGLNSRLVAEHFLPELSPNVKEAIQCHMHRPSMKNAARNPLWALIHKADHADAATSPGRMLKFMKG